MSESQSATLGLESHCSASLVIPGHIRFSPNYARLYQLVKNNARLYQMVTNDASIYKLVTNYARLYKLVTNYAMIYQCVTNCARIYQLCDYYTSKCKADAKYTSILT